MIAPSSSTPSTHERGLDLADALHLVRSSAADAFATFDMKLVRRAKKLAVRPPVRSA